MADIAKCMGYDEDLGFECPMKNNCYRYTAKANEFRQSYFMNIPFNPTTCQCDNYWSNSEYKRSE